MATGRYRSVFHTDLPADEAFAAAEQQLRSWLGQKRLDREAFDKGSARVGSAGEVLLVLARNSADGTQTKRWQLREPKDGGSWVSTLTVHAPGRTSGRGRSWFWLDVEFSNPQAGAEDQDSMHGRKAGVPRLARGLLSTIDARDSLAELRERPILVRPSDIEALIDVLCDPDRRMPTIVASAHPRRDFKDWRDVIDGTMREAAGLASLYLLDPPATDQFVAEVGKSHGVWGGAVRTYLPVVDPASDQDALRHRVLSASRIEDSTLRAGALLSGLPRRLSAEALLPRPLTGLSRALLAERSGMRRPGDVPLPDVQEAAEALSKEVGRIKDNLDAALELVAEAEQTEQRLAQRNEDLAALSIEFDAVNQRAEYLEDRVRALERRLVQAGRTSDATAQPDEQTILPTSFAEVVDRTEELARIEFTGDIDHPLDLDTMPSASSWAQTAWQALLAMDAYAKASSEGSFNGGFPTWCKQPPPGARAISPGKIAPDESATVRSNPKMSRHRLLPVPKDVEPSGKVYMWAHVRLGAGAGMRAPRMHYFDDVKNTGKIYVGYLGPHLPVKSTN
ncbi:hypothetical protein BKA00_002880 [Actinomadura coerulea]|uniref:Uncharacterized protein n=1 Tax=Actinomadura coerulea TaxID=46159 RepID=A0A7X0G000_9ACTN|nr:hypothetical protein [Actinomadura coerulea]MBB6395966.1 hypothetical protein [Actinomadura coerulea]GGQ30658.1 hypothetical protein GCM10010187_54420 [Actinomadura coerulea]